MIYDITIFYNRSNFQTQPSISAGIQSFLSHSCGFHRNLVIPAGMCGAVKSTGGRERREGGR